MIRRCACAVAAAAYCSMALGQDSAATGGSHQTGSNARPQPLGNPLWRIPIGSLSATRERPLFSASRRPPPPQPSAPPPTSAAAPPPPAEPERPPLTLQGTAIGKRDFALVLDEAAKGSVRLQVGEAAEGWYLRSVDRGAVTLEKDTRIVVLSLPPPGAAPSNPPAPASDPPRQSDAGPRSKTGADWISRARVLY
jgi:hypothetical protein